jgi:co-chaperonin GroES (HSP10)
MELYPIKLLGDRLIVRRIPYAKTGLIEFPQSLQDDNNVGGSKLYWVMLTGPGRRTKKGIRVPIECDYGDRVILHSYIKGVDHVSLPEGDVIVTADQILAVLPKEDKNENRGSQSAS